MRRMASTRSSTTTHADRRAAGLAVLARLSPDAGPTALDEALGGLAPDFSALTVEACFGEVMARPGLDLARREIATIAALCALGRERQLAAHLDFARNVGVTRAELVEVLMQMAVYAGWPAAVSGLAVASERFTGHDAGGVAYGLTVGGVRVTVVSDGHVELPAAVFGAGVDPAGVQQLLDAHGIADPVPVALNAMVIEHPDALVLVDPGSGPAGSPNAHGLVPDGEGHLLRNLRRAGFAPAEVDLLILTHGHHDHWGAVIDDEGAPRFPNARVAISDAEFRHWRDVGDYGKAQVPPALANAARVLGRDVTAAIADRTVWLRDGEEVLPGLTAMASPGHTVGHASLALEDRGECLLVAGDVTGHHVIQLRLPASHMAPDYDGAQAIASRAHVLQWAHEHDALVHAFHWPWPGLGRVVPDGTAWTFVPLRTANGGR